MKNYKRYFLLVIFLLAGTMLTESFQCVNRNVTTAKTHKMNKEYKKAEESLQKALKENPKDEEALLLMVEIKQLLGDYEGWAATVNEAEKYVETQKYKVFVPQYKHQLWVEVYNKGISYFNDYISQKNKLYLDSAIWAFDIAISVRPEMPDFYDLKGRTYEAKGDTARAIDTYKKYVQLLEDEIAFAKSKNIFLDITHDEALKRLGTPTSSVGNRLQSGDSVLTDVFMAGQQEVFLFLQEKKPEPFKVKGWRVDPPEHWPDFERSEWKSIEISPIASLAQIYFERKDYESSLKYVKMMTILEPSNAQTNAFAVELYSRLGRSDEALKNIKEMAEKYPDNKLYLAQYGDLLLNMKKYDEAIEQYEKSLKIDPNYTVALLNSATSYKNRASIVQREELEKQDKDKKYVIKIERYQSDLKKSGEYFERARMSPQYENDFSVLGELVNIYNVLEDSTKTKRYLGELEEIEYIIEPKNKEEYYRIMCKIYTDLKMADERKRFCDKFQELLKK